MNLLENIIRIGEVQSINESERTVRVMFPDTKIMSGWLKVIKSPPFIPSKGEEQKTETASGQREEGTFDEHFHNVIINAWFPSIGDNVLCIFVPVFNGDGYVIGEI